ncbi:hypothetical protein BKA82DRAFT_175734 [Pisolithus tinctorius]|uniref:Uncharacterized protein n=1 Tax=Pisolithus tinctorius Marx 270 TaxID=870435 RepID=A0A0C3KYB4_PISTI|nr:hypothetical protein BKA82DRAFT_175734 [Pisolithus tinctorius]KIO14522.1 hypothetical protein M404DRAFT_175734 [Pisolithus tinctorius Marx 270]
MRWHGQRRPVGRQLLGTCNCRRVEHFLPYCWVGILCARFTINPFVEKQCSSLADMHGVRGRRDNTMILRTACPFKLQASIPEFHGSSDENYRHLNCVHPLMSSQPYSGATIRCGPRHDHRYRQCVPDQFIGHSNRECRFSVICKEFRFCIPSRSDLPFGSLLSVATILIIPGSWRYFPQCQLIRSSSDKKSKLQSCYCRQNGSRIKGFKHLARSSGLSLQYQFPITTVILSTSTMSKTTVCR